MTEPESELPKFNIDMEQVRFTASERKEMYRMLKYLNLQAEMDHLLDPVDSQGSTPFSDVDYHTHQIHNMGQGMFNEDYAQMLAHYMAIAELKEQIKLKEAKETKNGKGLN